MAAVAPDAGETIQYQLDKYPSDIFTRIEVANGRVWLQPNVTEVFCGDLSEEEQKVVWATHYAPTMVSERMGGSSHIPMLSKPEVVIGVIREAAAAIAGK